MSDFETFADYVVNGGDKLECIKATVAHARYHGLTDAEIIEFLCADVARLNKAIKASAQRTNGQSE